MVPIVAGVAAGFVALGHDEVDPGVLRGARACSALPTSAATTTSWSWAGSTSSAGGGPRALATRRIGWLNATSSRFSAACGETLIEPEVAVMCPGSSGTP